MDAEIMERMNREFGLADPIHVRFAKYVVQLAHSISVPSFRTRQPSRR